MIPAPSVPSAWRPAIARGAWWRVSRAFWRTADATAERRKSSLRTTLRMRESEEIRSAMQPLDSGGARRIRYGGRRERSRFTDALIQESGAAPDIVRFALLGDPRCPLTTGANRNALLLDTIDSLVLNVDDDTRSDIAMAPGAEAGVSFFTGYDPTEFWFFPTAPPPYRPFRSGTSTYCMRMRRCWDAPSPRWVVRRTRPPASPSR